MAGITASCCAGAAVLTAGIDSWFVADDFVHLGYMRFVDHPWRFFYHPVLGEMIFRPLGIVKFRKLYEPDNFLNCSLSGQRQTRCSFMQGCGRAFREMILLYRLCVK